MNVEQLLITKIIQKQDFRSAMISRISASMFKSAEARQMFKAIQEYYNNPLHFGRTPSRRWLSSKFPSFQPMNSRETVIELCEILRTKHMTLKIGNSLEDISRILEGDGPYKALSLMRSSLMKVQTLIPSSRDIFLSESADKLITAYKRIEKAGGLLGVPFPWTELNVVTQGIHTEDFILVYGRAKSMKTWLSLVIAVNAYLVGNRRVLYYSCEMPPEQLVRRVASILCRLNYDLLRRAKLPKDQKEEYFKRIKSLKKEEEKRAKDHKPAMLITSDKDDPAGGGVSHLVAKAEEFKPHLIIADSYYRMRNDRNGKRSMDWKDQAAITQDLKHATQSLRIPIIGVTQQNRKNDEDGAELRDVGFTDAGGAEVDLAFRVKKEGVDRSNGHVRLTVTVSGSREFSKDGFALSVLPSEAWDWDGWIQTQEYKPDEGKDKKRKGKDFRRDLKKEMVKMKNIAGKSKKAADVDPLEKDEDY